MTTYERFTADHPDGRTLQPVKGTGAGDVVTDTVGGLDIVAFCVDDAIHAFENVGYDFERVGGDDAADKRERFRADGTTWDGITGVSADGRELERVPAGGLYAFAWQGDHGSNAFYEP